MAKVVCGPAFFIFIIAWVGLELTEGFPTKIEWPGTCGLLSASASGKAERLHLHRLNQTEVWSLSSSSGFSRVDVPISKTLSPRNHFLWNERNWPWLPQNIDIYCNSRCRNSLLCLAIYRIPSLGFRPGESRMHQESITYPLPHPSDCLSSTFCWTNNTYNADNTSKIILSYHNG